MALTLITGLPGAGKTTYLIDTVEKQRYIDNQKRAVYYYIINELKTDWEKLEHPREWPTLPEGAIIVIDECQDVFPQTKIGESKPEYYQQLAKHRHKGFDIYLVTQDPGLIDAFVRKLCEHHCHLKRRFGLEGATLFKGAQGGVFDVRKELYKQYKSAYKFPKKVQKLYHSAEIHTVKKSFPVKLLIFPLAVVGVIIGGTYFFDFVNTFGDDTQAISQQTFAGNLSSVSGNTRLAAPERLPNRLSYGALAGSQIYFLGRLNERLLVEVNGSVLQGRSLKRLGYTVVYVDECLITVSLTAVTCKPVQNDSDGIQGKGGGVAQAAKRAPPAPSQRDPQPPIQQLQVSPGEYVLPGIQQQHRPAGEQTVSSARYDLRTIN